MICKLNELRIAITKKCNMRCKHCYSKSGKEDRELPIQIFKDIIKDISYSFNNFKKITETGGEPLLPDKIDRTLELARYAQEKNIKVRLVSNGYYLDEGVAGELKEIGFSSVQISIDSSTHKMHDKFRGTKGAFDKAIEAVNNLVSAGVYTTIRYSITEENKMRVLDTYNLAQDLNASEFVVKLSCPFGRAKNSFTLIEDKEYLINLQKELISMSKKSLTKVIFLQPFLIDPKTVPTSANIEISPCKCGTSVLYVDSRGDVFPCNYMGTHPTKNFKIGNIKDHNFNIIREWYNHPELRFFRRPLKERGCCTSFKYVLGPENYNKFFEQRKFEEV